MYSLLALAVTAFTACVIAQSPGINEAPNDLYSNDLLRNAHRPRPPLNYKTIREYLLPYLRSQYINKDEKARMPRPRSRMSDNDWLNEEIERLDRMQEPAPLPYDWELPGWVPQEPFKRILYGSFGPYGTRGQARAYSEYPLSNAMMTAGTVPRKHAKHLHQIETTTNDRKEKELKQKEHRKSFALTPLDAEYFEPTEKNNSSRNSTFDTMEGPHEGGGYADLEDQTLRETRQNPISRTKTLVADDLNKLKTGVESDDENSKDKPHYIRVLGSEFARGTVYAVGIAAGIGIVFVLAILGFVFGWYTLSKRAKAAAEVDYPAYGVTGPTMDTSGDRKLAQSAQMYHYQHQKQQIIAMERNNVEQRNGSVSDPESEEENEEGDYTVYECPGFATTGDMEVKNPLFNDDPTPATPGKVEVVKPQPKE